MGTNDSDAPLTVNGKKLRDRARKHLKLFADHSRLSLEDAVAWVLASGEPSDRRRGPKPRNWIDKTGYPLSRLTRRIQMEQALAKGSSGANLTTEQAFHRILKRHWANTGGGTFGPKQSVAKLLTAYQHAVRNPAVSERQTLAQQNELRMAIAWLDHVERKRRGKPEPAELNFWRIGPSWVRVGTVEIMNGRTLPTKASQRNI